MTSIPAISLHQPWASLIAVGAKPYETRHWAPPARLIGKRIAIHAAKNTGALSGLELYDDLWPPLGGVFATAADLPLGAFVCTAVLAGAYQMEDVGGFISVSRFVPGPARLDRAFGDCFGDYSHGRWAWRLTDILPFEPPVPARGKQGFWNWSAP